MVQGIIAGGLPALTRSQEGAEDVVKNGALAMDDHGVNARDLVIGIAASGTTPYVRACPRARDHTRRARRDSSPVRRRRRRRCDSRRRHPDPAVTGPEVVTGSTRMKAGTATKLVLNMITTGAMIRLGKTYGNLMVDLRATNNKLNDRSERIVMEVSGRRATTRAHCSSLRRRREDRDRHARRRHAKTPSNASPTTAAS